MLRADDPFDDPFDDLDGGPFGDLPDDDEDTGAADPVAGYLDDLDRNDLIDLIKTEMARDENLKGRIRLRAEAARTMASETSAGRSIELPRSMTTSSTATSPRSHGGSTISPMCSNRSSVKARPPPSSSWPNGRCDGSS